MKNNYFKTNGNIQVTISGGYLIFVNKETNESIFLHEDEAKFMCKCLDDIFNKDRVFIYDRVKLTEWSSDSDIANIIRQKIEAQLEEHMLPMDGNMEFEIFGDLIKVTYRWSE